MKFLAFLLITNFVAVSSSESKYKLAPVVTNCPLLLPVKNYSQTVFFDMDAHAHPELKTCILQNSLSHQSVLLLNLYGSDLIIRLNVTTEFINTSDNPNFIIMTRYLTTKMVDSALWRFFIRSHWSLLYIIVTGDRQFKCKNNTMNPNEFAMLENIMNTLWHGLQIMRVGVIFPYACEQKMVIYNFKKPSTRNLYDRSIKLINTSHSKDLSIAIKKSGEKLTDDYPIQASIFFRYPTSIRDCKNLHYYVNFNSNLTNGYCGLDGMVMHDILSHLKFNLSFPENKYCDNYGYALPGNVSGVLGCIIRKELDISFNSRFMTLYSDEHIYYLHYIKTDTLCALVRKPDVIPLWCGVFNLFSPLLWALISAVLVAIGGIMWATAMINKTMMGPETMNFWWYLHNSVTTTLLGYSPMKTRTCLILRTTCLLSSIFFLAVYQGHLSRLYTTVERYQQVKTLEQLYSSGATLYTSPSVRELLRQLQVPENKQQAEFFDRARFTPGDHLGDASDTDDDVQTPAHQATTNCQIYPIEHEPYDFVIKLKIYQRSLTDWGSLTCWPLYNSKNIALFTKNQDGVGEVLQHTRAVTVDRKSDAEMEITHQFSDRHGTPLVDIVDECFYTYYLSYIARAGFPFYEDLQVVTERLNEAGLPTMYYKWTRQMLDIPNSKPQRYSEPRAFFKISLGDQRVAFVILFVGTVLSVLVFAAEMWNGKTSSL